MPAIQTKKISHNKIVGIKKKKKKLDEKTNKLKDGQGHNKKINKT